MGLMQRLAVARGALSFPGGGPLALPAAILQADCRSGGMTSALTDSPSDELGSRAGTGRKVIEAPSVPINLIGCSGF